MVRKVVRKGADSLPNLVGVGIGTLSFDSIRLNIVKEEFELSIGHVLTIYSPSLVAQHSGRGPDLSCQERRRVLIGGRLIPTGTPGERARPAAVTHQERLNKALDPNVAPQSVFSLIKMLI